MARHFINQSAPRQADHGKLVEALVAELKNGTNPQPAFIERAYKDGKPCEVNVIWDKWVGVPEDERSDVIRQAYESFEPDIAASLEFAFGYTSADAVSAGLLPFVVYYSHRSGIALIDREKAKDSERVNTILGSEGRELRYPTEEAAEEAIERLEKVLPGSKWLIKEQIEN